MGYSELRKELYEYYLNGDAERAKGFADKCFKLLNQKATDDMSVARQKMLQYEIIRKEFEPKLFKSSPFYYETGVLVSLSDGARYAKGHDFVQANGWVFQRNEHKLREFDEELYNRRTVQGEEMLYLICGVYNDDCQHFNLNLRPILKNGLKGLYEKAQNELKKSKSDTEKDFLNAVCFGMLQLKKMRRKIRSKSRRNVMYGVRRFRNRKFKAYIENGTHSSLGKAQNILRGSRNAIFYANRFRLS